MLPLDLYYSYTYIIIDSLPCVVFVTIVVIYAVLLLCIYMQMVQNVLPVALQEVSPY